MKEASNRGLGMFRAVSCVPAVRPCDIEGNTSSIIDMIEKAESQGADLAVFPELSVTGYTCADLFNDSLLLDASDEAVARLSRRTAGMNVTVVAGAPVRRGNRLYNCAVVMRNGGILGIVPKSYLPNYNEFYEKRWFATGLELPPVGETVALRGNETECGEPIPFGTGLLFDVSQVIVGVELCEDLWVPNPPSGGLCMAGAEVIANLSASDSLIGKRAYATELIANQSARCRCGYIYSSAGFGESSTDLAFTGHAVIAENGNILRHSPEFRMGPGMVTADIDIQHLRHDRLHFSSFADNFNDRGKYSVIPSMAAEHPRVAEPLEYRDVDPTPFVDKDTARMERRCDEISAIQAWGLATRLKAIGCDKCVIGISGGLDSTLALLVTAKAFDMLGLDRKGIYGITMPGFGTTRRTKSNAERLMELLGVTSLEIPIGEAVNMHFRDIDHDASVRDITYENCQARERTQILMDYANKVNGLVIGTGDLSELALGWCTYNGDQMSMYGVNSSIPKTMVRYLVSGYARQTDCAALRDTLLDIVDTPISPELLPAGDNGEIAQKTEDTVGPYELHDFFLYHLMRFGEDPLKIAALALKAFDKKYSITTIYKWLRTFYKRFFSQQFKRSCMPDGVKVGSICLSPRGDWRMPSDATAALWLKRIDSIDLNNCK